MVVVLAGGTGGAKLARGMLDVVGDELVVVANTADDIEAYGAYVCPDPDLCAFWLADRIDERGWGLKGDTFHAMDQLRELGVDVWFNLGDRDLAIGLRRAQRLAEGATLTQAIGELTAALGLEARVLPMADQPVRTRVLARGRWVPFQEFMIRERGEGPVDGVELQGIEAARAARGGPRRDRGRPRHRPRAVEPRHLRSARSSRSRASPTRCAPPRRRWWPSPRSSAAQVLKGPTAAFMAWAGLPVSAAGTARAYGDLVNGMVADEPFDALPALRDRHAMDDADARRRAGARRPALRGGAG